MGLIRKTLSVGTAGVVKGSSKKQRVAKSTERAARSTERAARSTAAAGAAAAAAADLAQRQQPSWLPVSTASVTTPI